MTRKRTRRTATPPTDPITRIREEWLATQALTTAPPSAFDEEEDDDTITDEERLVRAKSERWVELIGRLIELKAHHVAIELIAETTEEEDGDRLYLYRNLIIVLIAEEEFDTARDALVYINLPDRAAFEMWLLLAKHTHMAADVEEARRCMDLATRQHSNQQQGYLDPLEMQVSFWKLTQDPLDLEVAKIMQKSLPANFQIRGFLYLVRADPTVDGYLMAYRMAEKLTHRDFQKEMVRIITRDVIFSVQHLPSPFLDDKSPAHGFSASDVKQILDAMRPEWRQPLLDHCDRIGLTL